MVRFASDFHYWCSRELFAATLSYIYLSTRILLGMITTHGPEPVPRLMTRSAWRQNEVIATCVVVNSTRQGNKRDRRSNSYRIASKDDRIVGDNFAVPECKLRIHWALPSSIQFPKFAYKFSKGRHGLPNVLLVEHRAKRRQSHQLSWSNLHIIGLHLYSQYLSS